MTLKSILGKPVAAGCAVGLILLAGLMLAAPATCSCLRFPNNQCSIAKR